MWQSGLKIRAIEPEPFSYLITATGTENVTNAPPQRFNYTVTGNGTEIWSETVATNKNLSFAVSPGQLLSKVQSFTFTPQFDGEARISYGLSGKPGSLASRGGSSHMSLELDGEFLCSGFSGTDGDSGSCEFDSVLGKTYLLTLGASGVGRASATVRLPDRVTVIFTAQRTSSDTRSGTVSAVDGDKEISPIGVNAFPMQEKGGQIGSVSYDVTDDNADVEVRIQNGSVFARTAYIESRPQAWQRAETGRATLSSSDGTELIATSTLTAPNGDTRWTVEDDNLNVETSMNGNRLFAKVVNDSLVPTHPADTNKDFRIIIGEITAYGGAWKRGQDWPLPPNPIPISYLTRAAGLWKGGEGYRYDPQAGAPPVCWMSGPR